MFTTMSTEARSQLKQTKLNHFVSRFTSRPWLMGTSQFYKLWADKSGVRATAAGPKSWGAEEYLYTQDVEDAFQDIETRIARLQGKLQSGCCLNQDERYGWAMWLLASYLRTPTAFLCSAEVGTTMNGFMGDLFRASYGLLAACVTNPYCIELVANREWQILTCEKPYFLKPDSGVVLTDRLDSPDCLILYPLTPFSCFVATGNQRRFSTTSVQRKRVFGLNNHILRWCDSSVACTTHFWERERFMLRHAVQTNLAAGHYSPPNSGRFFSIESLKCDGQIRATILAPRGPMVITIAESAIRPVDGGGRPKIPGLYDVENRPDVALEVRYSDDENEIDYSAAGQLMMHMGHPGLAVDFARKALEKNKNDLLSKLIILAREPTANVGELTPETPGDAAALAVWWAMAKRDPLQGLKITSSWLRKHPDHGRLAQVNFLCAFLVYGARLFQALCGKGENLPYLEDCTPLPDGVLDLVKRVYSHAEGGVVSEVQRQIGNVDIKASGLAADVLTLCGLNQSVRLYTRPISGVTSPNGGKATTNGV